MLVKTSKLYNGKEHTFTTLGVATNVVLKSGNGEQFQIQGTLNIVDGPDNPADILINGNNIGSGVSLSNLSDVDLTLPIANGSLLEYNSTDSKWTNSTVLNIPTINSLAVNATNITNDFTVLEVTSIQRLKCDNIRTGLTDCILGANSGERIIPLYTDLNLNLTGGFLNLDTVITATTIGADCQYSGGPIKSHYGGTGHANSYGFVNTTSDDIHCDQDLSQTSEVIFGLVNGLQFDGEDYTGDNFVTIGQGAGVIGSMKNSTILGNQAAYYISALDKATIIGDSSGYQTSGQYITLLGHNVGITPTSSKNIIMIGNNNLCDYPSANINNYFCIKGNSTDPIIQSYNTHNSSIMSTTMYGSIVGNFSNFSYNSNNIQFTVPNKFDQNLCTTASPSFNDIGIKDLSLTYSMNLNCNETLSGSRTINLKCLDASRDFTLRDNLDVGSNYISYGTQYLNFTGTSLSFGTNTNFSTGKLNFINPKTATLYDNLTIGTNYISYGTQYLNFTGKSISFGTDTTFSSGNISFINPCTLNVTANSFINQDVRTSGTPYVTRLGVGVAADSTIPLRVTGAGSSTSASSNLALFDSGLATAGNLYSICVGKTGTDSVMLGVNKNSASGSVAANSSFLTTYFTNSTLTLGRGNSGLPSTADIVVTSTGVTINNLLTTSISASTNTVNITAGGYATYYPAEITLQPGYLDNGQDYSVFLKAYPTGSGGSYTQNFQIGINPRASATQRILLNSSSSGQVTFPLQSSFKVYRSANVSNVTGDGTSYTLTYDTAIDNINSNYNTGTYTYTTPVAGVYTFTAAIKINNISSSHTIGYADIAISGGNTFRIWQGNPYVCRDSNGYLTINGSSGPTYIAASTGVTVTLVVSGGTKTIGFITDGSTTLTSFFTGTLLH